MNLLVTGGNSPLARALIASLHQEVYARSTDWSFPDPNSVLPNSIAGDLRDREFAQQCLEGIDTILHLSPLIDSPGFSAAPGEDDDLLDRAARGTYVLFDAALRLGVRRFILGSTLNLFDRLPVHWRVNESWRPRPEPRAEQLGPWLAELSSRESVRSTMDARTLCLRFGRIIEDQDGADTRSVHVNDALQGMRRAIEYVWNPERRAGWRVFHITAAGRSAKVRLGAAGWDRFGYQPEWEAPSATAVIEGSAAREVTATSTEAGQKTSTASWREILVPPAPIPSREIRKVVIFGAGGPVGSALAAELQDSYTLRLADLRPLDEIAREAKPQFPGAPLPSVPPPPHESRIVDVRDPDAVMAACEGMDAIVNCSVLREHPVDAFRVNMLGFYHILQAAVRNRIRRVVQTGPLLVESESPVGYGADYEVPGLVPARPGRALYGHSKFLGQEIGRVFAEYYDMEIPVLHFMQFLNPDFGGHAAPFSISWQDSARAIRRALEVERYPSPYEPVHITADLPHGRFSAQRAKEILGWEAQDSLERLWTRGATPTG